MFRFWSCVFKYKEETIYIKPKKKRGWRIQQKNTNLQSRLHSKRFEGIARTLERYAQKKRECPTKAEQCLKLLLIREIIPFHFQYVIDQMIVDFFLPCANLIIEVDGGYHLNQMKKDQQRDAYMFTKKGYNTLRLTNDQVLNDDNVISKIEEKIKHSND